MRKDDNYLRLVRDRTCQLMRNREIHSSSQSLNQVWNQGSESRKRLSCTLLLQVSWRKVLFSSWVLVREGSIDIHGKPGILGHKTRKPQIAVLTTHLLAIKPSFIHLFALLFSFYLTRSFVYLKQDPFFSDEVFPAKRAYCHGTEQWKCFRKVLVECRFEHLLSTSRKSETVFGK